MDQCHEKYTKIYRNKIKKEKGTFVFKPFEVPNQDPIKLSPACKVFDKS